MTQDYDEVRPDVAERSAEALKEVEALDTPATQTVAEEFDGSDLDGVQEPPGAIIDDELVVEVRPQAQHEFICDQCFLVRHSSRLVEQDNSIQFCQDCAAD